MPMLTMVPTAMAWPTMDMAMVLPTTAMATMDMVAMPIPMPTMDTTARGLLMLMLLPLLMLTMVPMAMVWPTTDTDMVLPTTDMDMLVIPMPTMDTLTDSTDIINLFIFVKN